MATKTHHSPPATPRLAPFTSIPFTANTTHAVNTPPPLSLRTSQQSSRGSTAPNTSLSQRRRSNTLFKTPFHFTVRRRASSTTTPSPTSSPHRAASVSSSSTSSLPRSPTSTTFFSSPLEGHHNPGTVLLRRRASSPSSKRGELDEMGFPFGRAVKEGSRRGRDLGSAGENAKSRGSPTTSTSPSSHATFDAHPGTLVDFSSPSSFSSASPYQSSTDTPVSARQQRIPSTSSSASTTGSTSEIRENALRRDEYHRFLRITARSDCEGRRSSAPTDREMTTRGTEYASWEGLRGGLPSSPVPPAVQHTEQRQGRERLKSGVYRAPLQTASKDEKEREMEKAERGQKERLANIDYKSRKLVQRERAMREGRWEPIPLSRSASVPFPPSTADERKASSSSGGSVEGFLKHVRGSFEHRRSESFNKGKADYNIFKEEWHGVWFLGHGDEKVLDSSRREG